MEEVEEHMIGGAAGGTPGVEENPPEYVMPEDGSERYDKVSRVINYELNEINKEIRKAPGEVEAVTVAVLINQDALIDGNLTADKEREIADLIYAATGLDTRQVEVKSERFRSEELGVAEGEKGMNWLALILALVGGLSIVGYVAYRRKKDRELEELESELDEETLIEAEIEDLEFETEESKMKSQIENFVDKKPDAVAQLLRTWLNE